MVMNRAMMNDNKNDNENNNKNNKNNNKNDNKNSNRNNKIDNKIYFRKFLSYDDIRILLYRMGCDRIFSKQKKIVIKPNLVSNLPYPVTTDANVVEEFIKFIRDNSNAKIIVAEGSGDDTERNYRFLGYTKLKDYGIELVDLNYYDVEVIEDPNRKVLKKFHFPKILKDSFLISVANIKEHHTEAKVTLTLKNMFGTAPGKYYSHNIRGRPWSKEMFHDLGINDSIVDINVYKLPDMGFLDGRILQLDSELGGRTKEHGYIYASFNPIALDYYCAKILTDEEIKYINDLAKIYEVNLDKIIVHEVSE